MSIGFFIDRNHEPTEQEITACLGASLPLWDELIRYMRKTYSPEQDLKFLYGKEYGWGKRFRMKGKLLTNLFPSDGGFTVQIILNPKIVEIAMAMNIGENIRHVMEHATPFPEGCWLFIPVESEKDLRDIRQVLDLKVNTSRLKKG
jgi:hypothetical protein